MSEKKGKSRKAAASRKAAKVRRRKVESPKTERVATGQVSTTELGGLRRQVEGAKASLELARNEARALEEKAQTLVAQAREVYRAALTPYRDACRKAGVGCEYEGGRGANVTEKVSFLVEKTDNGVRVTVKGKPETEEVIPLAALKKSINQAAYSYTTRYLGPREKIGNKGGSLSNRLRAVMA